MINVVFPGEGSQVPGMGRPWRDHASWRWVERVSDATGRDIAELLVEADDSTLRRVDNAQLATAAHSLVVWDALTDSGVVPDRCIGRGVGEYVALAVAGLLDVDDMLRLVGERAAAMAEAAAANPGLTATVAGLDDEFLHGLCAMVPGVAWVARFEAHRRVDIAGTRDGIEAIRAWALEAGARLDLVPVDCGLHSPLMTPAGDRLAAALDRVEWRTGTADVLATLLARTYPEGSARRSVLLAHTANPERWRQTVGHATRRSSQQVFVVVGTGAPLPSALAACASARLLVAEHPDDIVFVSSAVGRPTVIDLTIGEALMMPDRLVVSPARGRFYPTEECHPERGAPVRAGQVLGEVGPHQVRSMFSGQLVDLLAVPGERVTAGQPIAWLRT